MAVACQVSGRQFGVGGLQFRWLASVCSGALLQWQEMLFSCGTMLCAARVVAVVVGVVFSVFSCR